MPKIQDSTAVVDRTTARSASGFARLASSPSPPCLIPSGEPHPSLASPFTLVWTAGPPLWHGRYIPWGTLPTVDQAWLRHLRLAAPDIIVDSFSPRATVLSPVVAAQSLCHSLLAAVRLSSPSVLSMVDLSPTVRRSRFPPEGTAGVFALCEASHPSPTPTAIEAAHTLASLGPTPAREFRP